MVGKVKADVVQVQGINEFEFIQNEKELQANEEIVKELDLDGKTDKEKIDILMQKLIQGKLAEVKEDEVVKEKIENIQENNKVQPKIKDLKHVIEQGQDQIQNKMDEIKIENARLKEGLKKSQDSKEILFKVGKKIAAELKEEKDKFSNMARQLNEICDQKEAEKKLLNEWLGNYKLNQQIIPIEGEIDFNDPKAEENYIICMMQITDAALNMIKELQPYKKSLEKIGKNLLGANNGEIIPHDVEQALLNLNLIQDKDKIIENYKKICRALNLPENISVNELLQKIEELRKKLNENKAPAAQNKEEVERKMAILWKEKEEQIRKEQEEKFTLQLEVIQNHLTKTMGEWVTKLINKKNEEKKDALSQQEYQLREIAAKWVKNYIQVKQIA